MLIKVLFTVGVIIAVAIIFRVKSQAQNSPRSRTKEANNSSGGVSSRVVVYTLLGLILSISALLFIRHWSGQHRIVNIRVTDSQGEIANYQAYRKTIEGRRFTTLDGVDVTLGASDRFEKVEQD